MAPREQGELQGIRPAHMKRLEDIQDDLESIDGKIAKLRQQRRDLNAEAVAIIQENKVETEVIVRGSNEWYYEAPVPKYKRRRAKTTKEDEKQAHERAKSKEKKERASA